MRKKSNPIVSKCNKCGKLQEPNKEKSTNNWEVYDCNVKCECGGDFRFLPKDYNDNKM